jgi:hypothetical protein
MIAAIPHLPGSPNSCGVFKTLLDSIEYKSGPASLSLRERVARFEVQAANILIDQEGKVILADMGTAVCLERDHDCSWVGARHYVKTKHSDNLQGSIHSCETHSTHVIVCTVSVPEARAAG